MVEAKEKKVVLKKFTLSFSVFLLVLCVAFPVSAGNSETVFPGKAWMKADKPEALGYSTAKLDEAKKFSETLKTSAVVIVVNGKILYEWGEVDKKYLTHSMRKSFLSALYGPYVEKGIIQLDRTMADLGIDDAPPLSEQEKTATIRDCLKARSGVFHTAEAENDAMHNLKPPANSLKPGTFWIYNNWDFNVLGTIFEKLTGKDIFKALKEDIADPIQMEQFVPEDGEKYTSGRSIHPSYMFVINARDCARFGLLMLRNGNWNGKQVIPQDWVKESTSYFSDATIYKGDGYGYMWWTAKDHNRFPHLPNVTLKEGVYSARGAGGHYIFVIPEYDMVFVHRVDTFKGDNVTPGDVGKLLQMILNAKTK